MSVQDRVTLMNRIEDTLKPRMYANLLEEATEEIQDTLIDFDIELINRNVEDGDDFLDMFLTAKKVEGCTEATLVRYGYVVSKVLRFAGIPAKEIRTEHIRSYIEHELSRGISPNTLKGERETLSSFFSWLFLERLIKFNPLIGVAPIRPIYDIKESYSQTDIERMKMACNNNIRDIAIIAFLNSSACRISEVVALNIEDVDLRKGTFTVFGKGKKERKAYLDDVSLMLLKEYLASRTDNNNALFVGKGAVRLHPGGVRALLKRIEAKSGVKNVHPHRFRRTKITNLLLRGMPIQDVAILAGHNKIDTTMRYYHSSEENIRLEYMKYSL